MQIPILSGIYADATDFRTSYPVNLIPVPKNNGISEGYLRPAEGLVTFATGPGTDRGGINWEGTCYRVMGSKLVSVNQLGVVTTLGDVGNDSLPVALDYSFDDLVIGSNSKLFLYNSTDGLRENVDPDLGNVIDFVWVDGYFMTTDGEFLVVTELNDPLAVNPLKYGSSEADPDPVKALLKIRNEVVALNRYTIEYFDNVGGDLFPFARIEGAQIEKGVIGTQACCVFLEAIAFVGGGFNESISIYIGSNGAVSKISTHEIDTLLQAYTEDELSLIKVESRIEKAHSFLYIHLPDRTLVYDAGASQELQRPIWFCLTSSDDGWEKYRARDFVRCYDKWLAGDPDTSNVCVLSEDVSSHYGAKVRWEFATQIIYNEGRGAILHDLELVSLTGAQDESTISTNYTVDGETWSNDRTILTGKKGQRTKRLVWFGQGHLTNWRAQRFKGTSDAHISFARLEARVEPLAF